MVNWLPSFRRARRRPSQSGAWESRVSTESQSSCRNRIRPMLPCACWTRELNCSYEVLTASLLNSTSMSGWLDAAEDAVQDGGERPFAVEDVSPHWDFEYLLRCHVDAPFARGEDCREG